MNLTVTKEKVLEAAKGSEEGKKILRALFPGVFNKDFKVGDIVKASNVGDCDNIDDTLAIVIHVDDEGVVNQIQLLEEVEDDGCDTLEIGRTWHVDEDAEFELVLSPDLSNYNE